MPTKPNLAALEASLAQPKPAAAAPEPKPASTWQPPPSRVGKKHVPVYLSQAQWRVLRQLSFDVDIPIQGLLVDAVGDLLRKYHRPVID